MPEQQAPSTTSQQREVASGVVNLGNTCYMNAVLQALAHAPELCLAIDHERHQLTCPIARENEERRRNSPTPSDDTITRKRSTRKSKRNGKKSPTTDSEESIDPPYCTLCELEDHISRVHQRSTGDPVAPETFVNGFIDQVAPPWFKLGVQEDSHEFLRLLIEAMQKSSTRNTTDEPTTFTIPSSQNNEDDNLYPFKLFRGTVESNVSCGSCHAMNSTIDPIEDIGLEVTQTTGSALSDLSSAFCRFTKIEPLTEYKCDRCHKMGKATKQSRLASIPPILTLHLKRFRYGSDGRPLPPPARRGREVSQLLGASGSAKIEGHIKFLEFFDLKPFLTEQLAGKVKSMFCRLFAVIVHAGKNSHSGHYVAYVRNLSKNEWWKMDDARVSRATKQEVLNAEAYMLFYRVVDHPVAKELRDKEAALQQQQQQQQELEKTKASTEEQSIPIDLTLPLKPEGEESARSSRKRRRELAEAAAAGAEWARVKTRLPPSFGSLFRRAEEFISEKAEFTPAFFKIIMEEAAKGKNGGPIGVCDENIQGGMDQFRPGLIELIYKLAAKANLLDGGKLLIKDDPKSKADSSKESKPIIVPVVEANETFL
mmetsp:Transcript_25492/g.42387  ORF Transcript_25492/g.42387 Transcript_25492/m.42387 type:complete len:596 (+) Transcript_25492:204-1991(+)